MKQPEAKAAAVTNASPEWERVLAAVRSTYSHHDHWREGEYPDTGIFLPENMPHELTEDYLVLVTTTAAFVMLTDTLLPHLRLQPLTASQILVMGERWKNYLTIILSLASKFPDNERLPLPPQTTFPIQDNRLPPSGRSHWFWHRDHHRARYAIYSCFELQNEMFTAEGVSITDDNAQELRMLGCFMNRRNPYCGNPFDEYDTQQKQMRVLARTKVLPPVPRMAASSPPAVASAGSGASTALSGIPASVLAEALARAEASLKRINSQPAPVPVSPSPLAPSVVARIQTDTETVLNTVKRRHLAVQGPSSSSSSVPPAVKRRKTSR